MLKEIRQERRYKIFEEMMAKNFSKFKENYKLNGPPSPSNVRTPRHIIIKVLKTSDKWNILK
jgi:hypothetical protein